MGGKRKRRMYVDMQKVDADVMSSTVASNDIPLFIRSRGQSLVEYALIIAFVAIAVIVALSLLAPTINSIFRAIPPAL